MPLPEHEMNQIDGALPPPESDGADGPKRTLSGKEALEKLRAGEPLENARIERLSFRGEFPLPVRLKNVTLVQPRFDDASFRDEVAFIGCTLDRPACGKECTFDKTVYLTGSTLVRAQFNRLTFRGKVSAENIHTRGRFVFTGCRFEAGVRFWEARFAGWAEFRDCAFTSPSVDCDFRSFHAEEGFVLERCQFAGNVLLRGATVSKKFEAASSRFDALLDFSKAKLHDYVYLENIEQGEKHRLAFTNTLGERIRIRTEQLTGRLASEECGDYEAAMHEYAFLKRAFESLHRYEQEDWAFYRFKVNQRRCCNRSWWRPWTKLTQFADWLLLDQGCGYCTDPFRAVRTAGIIILLFAVVYAVGIDQFYLDPTKMPFDGDATGLLNRTSLGLFKSVAVFTSGLSGIGDISKGWMNAPLIVESLLGTLLWGLFIVAFSRKVIR
jgi:hypothetical protein